MLKKKKGTDTGEEPPKDKLTEGDVQTLLRNEEAKGKKSQAKKHD